VISICFPWHQSQRSRSLRRNQSLSKTILRISGAQEGAAEFPQHFEVQSQPVQLYRSTGVAEGACLGVKGAEVMQL